MVEKIKGLAPPQKKIKKGTMITLAILLLLLGAVGGIYIQDESELGVCEKSSDCGRYNVFYFKGEGYVCANDQVIAEDSIKTKILMFKYASKKALDLEPTGCQCIESQCEVE